jgi:hypothetical protein
MTMKCARCKRPGQAFLMRMWNGHRGYRRYRLCERCVRELDLTAAKERAQHAVPLREAA